MANQEQDPFVSPIKVTRTRKRLYELPSEPAQLPEVGLPESDGARLADVTLPKTEVKPPVPSTKASEAHEIILKYVAWASGGALIPLPLFDVVAITAFEVTMLKRLCQLYGLEFRQQWGKSLIGALIGTLQTGLLAGSVLKLIPGIGLAGGMISTAAIAGAMTYAVGKVFVMHFETGGTLFDFDPARMQAYFADQYQEGRTLTAE